MSPENKVKALEAIDRWPEIWTSNQGAGASQ